MDKCLTEEPSLVAVGDAGEHRSACWLPVAAAGTAALEAEVIRRRAVSQGRANERGRQGGRGDRLGP